MSIFAEPFGSCLQMMAIFNPASGLKPRQPTAPRNKSKSRKGTGLNVFRDLLQPSALKFGNHAREGAQRESSAEQREASMAGGQPRVEREGRSADRVSRDLRVRRRADDAGDGSNERWIEHELDGEFHEDLTSRMIEVTDVPGEVEHIRALQIMAEATPAAWIDIGERYSPEVPDNLQLHQVKATDFDWGLKEIDMSAPVSVGTGSQRESSQDAEDAKIYANHARGLQHGSDLRLTRRTSRRNWTGGKGSRSKFLDEVKVPQSSESCEESPRGEQNQDVKTYGSSNPAGVPRADGSGRRDDYYREKQVFQGIGFSVALARLDAGNIRAAHLPLPSDAMDMRRAPPQKRAAVLALGVVGQGPAALDAGAPSVHRVCTHTTTSLHGGGVRRADEQPGAVRSGVVLDAGSAPRGVGSAQLAARGVGGAGPPPAPSEMMSSEVSHRRSPQLLSGMTPWPTTQWQAAERPGLPRSGAGEAVWRLVPRDPLQNTILGDSMIRNAPSSIQVGSIPIERGSGSFTARAGGDNQHRATAACEPARSWATTEAAEAVAGSRAWSATPNSRGSAGEGYGGLLTGWGEAPERIPLRLVAPDAPSRKKGSHDRTAASALRAEVLTPRAPPTRPPRPTTRGECGLLRPSPGGRAPVPPPDHVDAPERSHRAHTELAAAWQQPEMAAGFASRNNALPNPVFARPGAASMTVARFVTDGAGVSQLGPLQERPPRSHHRQARRHQHIVPARAPHNASPMAAANFEIAGAPSAASHYRQGRPQADPSAGSQQDGIMASENGEKGVAARACARASASSAEGGRDLEKREGGTPKVGGAAEGAASARPAQEPMPSQRQRPVELSLSGARHDAALARKHSLRAATLLGRGELAPAAAALAQAHAELDRAGMPPHELPQLHELQVQVEAGLGHLRHFRDQLRTPSPPPSPTPLRLVFPAHAPLVPAPDALLPSARAMQLAAYGEDLLAREAGEERAERARKNFVRQESRRVLVVQTVTEERAREVLIGAAEDAMRWAITAVVESLLSVEGQVVALEVFNEHRQERGLGALSGVASVQTPLHSPGARPPPSGARLDSQNVSLVSSCCLSSGFDLAFQKEKRHEQINW